LPSFHASERFEVENSLQDCWKFVSVLSNVGSCIPGCEEVRPVNDSTAFFRIKFKVGYLSKSFELKAKILETRPPSFLKFVGSGQDAEIGGEIELNSQEGASKTEIKYTIEINPISATGKTALTLIGKEIVRKQTNEFATCVRTTLEKDAQ
jgi:carbon monoxide dehydrogenase subunit G